MGGNMECKRDLLPYCETDSAYIIGNFEGERSRQGLDRISRAQINDIVPQVCALYGKGKHIVLDGDKATARSIFDALLAKGLEIKLIWIRCSVKTSIKRSQSEGIATGESHLKALWTKASNIYAEYAGRMNGEIIDTDNITDFSTFSITNYPKRRNQKRFAIFILSHGRAETITTYEAMRKNGYTGDMYVVIDNEDDQEPIYREKFGKEIIQFDKRDYVPLTDLGDLDDDRRIGVFARNFIQDKAQEMGYQYHLQLDDDIHGIAIRYADGDKLRAYNCKNIDAVLEAILEYMDNTPFTSMSLGLQAYLIGGMNLTWKKQLVPKCMTTFIMRASDKRYFHMRMNDDITTSAINNMRGHMYYSIVPIMVEVDETQVQKGGMTEIYQDNGTYRKSFYTVMALPSCTKISSMGITDYRVHHQIMWNNCAPRILSDRYRKVD